MLPFVFYCYYIFVDAGHELQHAGELVRAFASRTIESHESVAINRRRKDFRFLFGIAREKKKEANTTVAVVLRECGAFARWHHQH